jgi:general secretion pathway protein J
MSNRGFTLLELLVALAVFGFLLAGLSQTVRFGLSAWRTEARLDDSKTDLEAVDRSLRAIVENFQTGDDMAQSAIVGTATTLVGVTRLRVPGGGLTPIPIEAGLALSGNRLVLRWRPYRHAEALRPAPPPQETELMNGVARLAISYWQRDGVWLSAWQDAEMPLLIRVHLTFAGEHPPRWPDIVVAPILSRP